MKTLTIRVLPLLLTLVLLSYIFYSERLQIEAAMWHLKNGNFVRVDAYEVPVPKHWMVRNWPSGLFIVDSLPSGDKRTLSGINIVTVDSLTAPTPDLEFWKSYKQKRLKEEGVNVLEDRSLVFEGETVACLGGHELHELTQIPDSADIVSVDCRSSGRLHLMFVGQQPDLQVFYGIIQKIRRLK